MTETSAVDWSELISSWDRQQEGHLSAREERFTAMFDAIEVLVGEKFLALDLACGPGSISQRLLDRFPSARSVAVDIDPLLLALGQGALGTVDGRLRWAERDLRDPAWTAGLTETEQAFDAVLSTTAQHWFRPPQLAVLYRQLATIVRPGGVVLIGDYMPYDESQPSLARLARTVEQRKGKRAFQREGVLDWWHWWDHLSEIPALAELLAERERRLADPTHVDPTAALWKGPTGQTLRRPSRRFAAAALTEAGFQEVGSIWQRLDDCILLAVR